MKKYLFYATVLLLFSCCHGKKKMEQIQRDESSLKTEWDLSGQWQRHLMLSQDSGMLHWTFLSDSPFIFHPDSGLRANNGLLALSEHYQRDRYVQQDSTTIRYHLTDSTQKRQASKQVEEHLRSPSRMIGWVLGAILLLAIARGGWKSTKSIS